MKVMITGATGLLGRELFREFSSREGFEAVGVGFSRARDPLLTLDLRKKKEIDTLVSWIRPQVIIHAAAERKPDTCEKDPEGTRQLNVEATRSLVEAARSVDAHVLYFSTDYVFDGSDPPYSIDDTPGPLNAYGQSKLDGELVVLEDPGSIVLRVPVLYGPVESPDESPVTVIAENVRERREVRMDHWATRFPTFTPDVASVCRQMVERRAVDDALRGIFHWSGDEPMTKYDMACVFARRWKIPEDTLIADSEPPSGAPRPRNARLDCSRLEDLDIGQRTSFEDGIRAVLGVED